jgi:hypothetical protein
MPIHHIILQMWLHIGSNWAKIVAQILHQCVGKNNVMEAKLINHNSSLMLCTTMLAPTTMVVTTCKKHNMKMP